VRNLGIGKNLRCSSRQTCLTIFAALLLLPAVALGQSFSQQAQGSGSGSSATFPANESAGDFNVVIVGWAGAATINPGGVTDSEGNTYVLAGTSAGNNVSQAIYYARNIKGDTGTPNTVNVAFSPSSSADVRVLEYSGVGTTVTVDNWVGASGSGGTANSGAVTTSTMDLVVGAGTTDSSFTNPPSGLPGNMTSRGVNTCCGDIAMDTNGPVAAPGPYSATAAVSGHWVMQVVAFSISGIATTAPTVTSINPTSGPTTGGTGVTITGTNFANGAVALFGTAPTGISLQNCLVTSTTNPTTMTCNTPPDNAGPKDLTVVNVDGQNGSLATAYDYSTNPPTISNINPTTSTSNGNAAITITGTNFESTASVVIGPQLPRSGFGLFADNVVVNQTGTQITFNTPAMPVNLLPDGTTPGSPANVSVVNPSGANSGTVTVPGALTYTAGNGPINFIQRGDAAVPSGKGNPIPIPMPNAQGKGNLNVVIIGWNDISQQVASVTDTEGNTYVAALPTTTDGVSSSQVIYYAKNIKGDSGGSNNQITVTFNQPASTPDVRVLEYSGLDPNAPLDQAVGNFGTTGPANSGACTTTSAVELIVAGTTVNNQVIGAGLGFTTVDYTFNGNHAEHQITSNVTSCAAQAQLLGSGWVIQSVSFKTPAGTKSPDFSLTANPPTTASVNAGSSASYGLTLTALNGFSSAVNLSCSGLPAGASCAFSPVSPVTPTSSGLAETVTISTQSTTPNGTSNITIKGTSGNLSHTVPVTLTVNGGAAGFTLSASALSPSSVSAGGSATSTVTVTATNGFTGAVSLSCSSITGGGSPAPACSFSASSVNGSGSSTLTVSTTGNTAKNLRFTGVFYAMLLPIGGMTLLGAGFTSRRKKLIGILLICLVVSGLVFMVACGGGSSNGGGGGNGGTPAGTYTITVQGTASGATTQTQTLTLTVQ
jgi:hypothetical protein